MGFSRHAGLGLALWLAAGLALYACSADSPTESAGLACTPQLHSIRTHIFDRKCIDSGCHGPTSPAAALDLSTEPLPQLIAVPSNCPDAVLVVPGDPESSMLYRKIASENSGCGDRMPVSGPLPANEIACIRDWIQSLDNNPINDPTVCERCGGVDCIELDLDNLNCGECDLVCQAGSACVSGQCFCAGGLAACGGDCVDSMTNSSHCGGCNKSCPQGASCVQGSCACLPGEQACSGSCVDIASNGDHCGACNTVCSGGQVCLLGQCSNGCGSLTQCGNSCVDTTASAAHCGGCDVVCPAGGACTSGQCVCPQGSIVCVGECLNVQSDPSNCGGCGESCPNGTVCQMGSCSCPNNGTLCGTNCIDTQTDTNHCGGCDQACASAQTCSMGNCDCSAGAVSFTNDVQPLFDANCVGMGCHGGVKVQADLVLTSGNSYGDLVNVATDQCNGTKKRVVPGDPAASYLINKLTATAMCTGTQMPKKGAISPAEVDIIGAWICGGAKND